VKANLDEVKSGNDIIVSDKLLSDLNLKVGDTVQSTVTTPTLKIKTTDGYKAIDPN
jgi:ABC-type lipoprotein release transport system permease subunit